MRLKTLALYPFRNWFQPILFSLVAFPLFILCIFIDNGIFQMAGAAFFFIGLLWLALSALFLLFKRQWGKSLYTMLVIVAIIISFSLLP